MNLNDYNKLAYEFAIRNPRVIELLHEKLTSDVAKELLSFGIDIKCEGTDNGGTSYEYDSLQWLNLNYDHLSDIKHLGIQLEDFNGGNKDDMEAMMLYQAYIGKGQLVHPEQYTILSSPEDIIFEFKRIDRLIETRGGKLQRLIDGIPFKHYDAITFFGETVYSLDKSTKTTKTIKKDIEFITEWINPDKYLQLLPQYESFLD
jgi:hypothetical protein